MTKMTDTAAHRRHRGGHAGAAPPDRAYRGRSGSPRSAERTALATSPSWPRCWPPRSTSGPSAAGSAGSPRPASRGMKRLADFDLVGRPDDQPGHSRHPRLGHLPRHGRAGGPAR